MGRRIAVLLCDRRVAPGLRSTDGRRVYWKPETSDLAHANNLFVLCHATDVHTVAKVVSVANRQHRLRALFIEQDVDLVLLLPMLDKAGLRMLRNVWVHQGPGLPEKVLNAWETGAHHKLIAHAAVVRDHLHILTCALEELAVPLPPRSSTCLPLRSASRGCHLQWDISVRSPCK